MHIGEYQTFGDIWQRHLHPYTAQFFDHVFPQNAETIAKEAMLDAVIHLPGWPESPPNPDSGATRRKLDILVHARERFSCTKPHQILESKIQVTYFRIDAQQCACPLSTCHYDYDREPRPGHPVYHFHCSNDPVSQRSLPRSWQYTLGPEPERSCFPFRVPTPHMCLRSVLIGLVADHLPCEQFKSLWETIKSNEWTPPLAKHCDLWSLDYANTVPRVLHNWQWYFWPKADSQAKHTPHRKAIP